MWHHLGWYCLISPGLTKATLPCAIPDEITEQTQLQSFCNFFLLKLNVLCKRMHVKPGSAQACCKCRFYKTVWQALHFHQRESFIDWPTACAKWLNQPVFWELCEWNRCQISTLFENSHRQRSIPSFWMRMTSKSGGQAALAPGDAQDKEKTK